MAPPVRSYDAILAIAAKLEPAEAKAFMEAVFRLRARISLGALAQAAETGRLTAGILSALEGWPADLRNAVQVVNQAFTQAGQAAATHLSMLLNRQTAFDMTNPFAVTAARTGTGFLVREIVESQRFAIQGVIERAIVNGMPPREAAKHIREIVGLTSRQAMAIETYRDSLRAGGLSWGNTNRAADKYAARLLRERALTIARTETIRAANDGQLALWRQAQADGLIGPMTRKRWITTPDDRRCAACAAMHGQEVLLAETFGGAGYGPPLHPKCRCAMALVPSSFRIAA